MILYMYVIYTYSEMITTVKLINSLITSHSFVLFLFLFFGENTRSTYSLSLLANFFSSPFSFEI